MTQELKSIDHSARRQFDEWRLEMKRGDTDFHRKVIFSDGAILVATLISKIAGFWIKNDHMPFIEVTVKCGLMVFVIVKL